MPDLQELRSSVRGRLLLTLSCIGAGVSLGVLLGSAGVLGHFPGPWGLPPVEASRLIFLFCLAGTTLLGASVGVGLAGHWPRIGLVWIGPGVVIVAYEFFGVGKDLPRGTYLMVTLPACAVLAALGLTLLPTGGQEGWIREEASWPWRAAWARLRGRPLPPHPDPRPHRRRTAKDAGAP